MFSRWNSFFQCIKILKSPLLQLMCMEHICYSNRQICFWGYFPVTQINLTLRRFGNPHLVFWKKSAVEILALDQESQSIYAFWGGGEGSPPDTLPFPQLDFHPSESVSGSVPHLFPRRCFFSLSVSLACSTVTTTEHSGRDTFVSVTIRLNIRSTFIVWFLLIFLEGLADQCIGLLIRSTQKHFCCLCS